MKCPHSEEKLTLIFSPQVALYEYMYCNVAKISRNKLFLVINSSFYFILQNSPHNVIVFIMKTNKIHAHMFVSNNKKTNYFYTTVQIKPMPVLWGFPLALL